MMIFIIIGTLLYVAMATDNCSNGDSTECRYQRAANETEGGIGDLVFDVPDIRLRYKLPKLEADLRAYKIKHPTRQNLWASVGRPLMMKNRDGEIYNYNAEFITFRLRLLPEEQEVALINHIKRVRKNVTDPYIDLIPLLNVTCRTTYRVEGVNVEYVGSARGFDRYELLIEIPCPENSKQRRQFQRTLKAGRKLRWWCMLVADGTQQLSNRVQISAQSIQEAAANTSLFGDQEEVYLTRNQTNKFAAEIRNHMQIKIDYEFEKKFDESLIMQLIEASASSFHEVPMAVALKKLSKYGLVINDEDTSANNVSRIRHEKVGDHQVSNLVGEASEQRDQKTEQHDQSQSSSSTTKVEFGGYGVGVNQHNAQSDTYQATSDAGSSANRNKNYRHGHGNTNIGETIGEAITSKNINVTLWNKNDINRNFEVNLNRKVHRKSSFIMNSMISTEVFIEDPVDNSDTYGLAAYDKAIKQLVASSARLESSIVQSRRAFTYEGRASSKICSTRKPSLDDDEFECDGGSFIRDMVFDIGGVDQQFHNLTLVTCCEISFTNNVK